MAGSSLWFIITNIERLGFFQTRLESWLFLKSHLIRYNAVSFNWPTIGFLQPVLYTTTLMGFSKYIFAGLHRNHEQGFHFKDKGIIPGYSTKYRVTTTVKDSFKLWWVILFSRSPESPQADDPALGGYIIQVLFITSMQVPCRCKHASRHLGANASWFSNHYIVNRFCCLKEMSRLLGATPAEAL